MIFRSRLKIVWLSRSRKKRNQEVFLEEQSKEMFLKDPKENLKNEENNELKVWNLSEQKNIKITRFDYFNNKYYSIAHI